MAKKDSSKKAEKHQVRKSALKKCGEKEGKTEKDPAKEILKTSRAPKKEKALGIKAEVLRHAAVGNAGKSKEKVEKGDKKERKTKDKEAKQEKRDDDPKDRKDKKDKKDKKEKKDTKDTKDQELKQKQIQKALDATFPKTPPTKRLRMKSPSSVSTTAGSQEYAASSKAKAEAALESMKSKGNLDQAMKDAELQAELDAGGMLDLLEGMRGKAKAPSPSEVFQMKQLKEMEKKEKEAAEEASESLDSDEEEHEEGEEEEKLEEDSEVSEGEEAKQSSDSEESEGEDSEEDTCESEEESQEEKEEAEDKEEKEDTTEKEATKEKEAAKEKEAVKEKEEKEDKKAGKGKKTGDLAKAAEATAQTTQEIRNSNLTQIPSFSCRPKYISEQNNFFLGNLIVRVLNNPSLFAA